jgi:hypothetical protein
VPAVSVATVSVPVVAWVWRARPQSEQQRDGDHDRGDEPKRDVRPDRQRVAHAGSSFRDLRLKRSMRATQPWAGRSRRKKGAGARSGAHPVDALRPPPRTVGVEYARPGGRELDAVAGRVDREAVAAHAQAGRAVARHAVGAPATVARWRLAVRPTKPRWAVSGGLVATATAALPRARVREGGHCEGRDPGGERKADGRHHAGVAGARHSWARGRRKKGSRCAGKTRRGAPIPTGSGCVTRRGSAGTCSR